MQRLITIYSNNVVKHEYYENTVWALPNVIKVSHKKGLLL